jgi:hypothetical protein
VLVTLAVVAFLVALQLAGLSGHRGTVVRVLPGRRGMKPTLSPWFLTGLVLGACTASAVSVVRAVQRVVPSLP